MHHPADRITHITVFVNPSHSGLVLTIYKLKYVGMHFEIDVILI